MSLELNYIYPLPFDESAYLAARAAYDNGTHDNNMTSAIELYEWKHNPPQHYALYLSLGEKNIRVGRATTWTGDLLGRAVFDHKSYSPVGGVFWAVTVYGSNGVRYYGRWFYQSGDVAIIHAHKNQNTR